MTDPPDAATGGEGAGEAGAGDPATAHRDLPGRLPQVFGVVGGMGAWGIALLTAYPTVQIACVVGQPLLVHLVRWVALVVAVAAMLTAWQVSRRAQRADEDRVGPVRVRNARLVGLGGALVSASGVLLLAMEDAAAWVIDPCQ